MAVVYLSIGSNIRREYYISRGLDALAAEFGQLRISSIYESEAVGFEGDDFYNLVVGLETDLALNALYPRLRKIEHDNERSRNAVKFSSRTLDIDILTYDDYVGDFDGGCLPRNEITRNAFVLWPLAELADDELHPQLRQSYGSLWQQFDRQKQVLWRVAFLWQGQQLSELD
ncbi:MAG: 2-amino-4-hydroxy-6-hydroxymethyldihydropteridine diphosphokinase [Motiliproteus sp.]